jgi:hypothetical protein
MDEHEPLHGSCMCGRNEYLIRIPNDVTNHAQVYFDTDRDHRKLTSISSEISFFSNVESDI